MMAYTRRNYYMSYDDVVLVLQILEDDYRRTIWDYDELVSDYMDMTDRDDVTELQLERYNYQIRAADAKSKRLEKMIDTMETWLIAQDKHYKRGDAIIT